MKKVSSITTWQVQQGNPIQNIVFANGHFTHGGSSAVSVYNRDQRAVINAFKNANTMDKDALYLFYIENVQGRDADGDFFGYMPLGYQSGFIYGRPDNYAVAHELAHGAFNLYHTFSTNDFVAPQKTTKNLMDYANGTELWKFQWQLIHNPKNLWLKFLQDEEEGEQRGSNQRINYAILVSDRELNVATEIHNKPLADIRKIPNTHLIICDTDINRIKEEIRQSGGTYIPPRHTIYYFGVERPELYFYPISEDDRRRFSILKHTREVNNVIHFTDIDIAYQIIIELVTPNIAYKQGNEINHVIREEVRGNETVRRNRRNLSSNEIKVRPFFSTITEKGGSIENVTALFERNEQVLSFVNDDAFIDLNGTEIKFDANLDWIDFPLVEGDNICKIKIGEYITEGIIHKIPSSPFVTVVRDIGETRTGYYIEDYYISALGNNTLPHSLRKIGTNDLYSMKTADFKTPKYIIPIVHYSANTTYVNLRLIEIEDRNNDGQFSADIGLRASGDFIYKIGDQTVKLLEGGNFSIKARHGETLDITDARTGEIKGKIEFRRITDSWLRPTLNIVTVNDNVRGFETFIDRLNDIYITMNVSWQQGSTRRIDIDATAEELAGLSNNSDLRRRILNEVRRLRLPDYSDKEYYMIVVPGLAEAGFVTEVGGNMFFVSDEFDAFTVAHELGHCGGLRDFVVNIGAVAELADHNAIDGHHLQRATSNVMGYNNARGGRVYSREASIDFYSWQIEKIRKNINDRINR